MDDGAARVGIMFHPSHFAPSLEEAEAWYQRVLGRKSTPISSMFRDHPPAPGHPTDYSTFTLVQDVLMDTIQPDRYIVLGEQPYEDVTRPHLIGLGWYVEDIAGVYHAIREHNIRTWNQFHKIEIGPTPPTTLDGVTPLYFTYPEDTGIRYQMVPARAIPVDPRTSPDWVLPEVSDDDPLGIERASHHTILTSQPERALGLLVDVLGGVVVGRGRDELLSTQSTFVRLSGSLFEFAVPDGSTVASAELARFLPRDSYYGITWKVSDLDRVERHLANEGVTVQARSGNSIITDPDTSLGIAWGFTTDSTPEPV